MKICSWCYLRLFFTCLATVVTFLLLLGCVPRDFIDRWPVVSMFLIVVVATAVPPVLTHLIPLPDCSA